MTGNESTLLSLRVDPETAREFKIEAASRGMRQNELFEEIVTAYLKARRGAKGGLSDG